MHLSPQSTVGNVPRDVGSFVVLPTIIAFVETSKDEDTREQCEKPDS